LFGFLRQGVAGRRRLLDHGRILLSHLIHLIDSNIYLSEPVGSLLRATGYFVREAVDLSNLSYDPLKRYGPFQLFGRRNNAFQTY
jgi:hypothetical protein